MKKVISSILLVAIVLTLCIPFASASTSNSFTAQILYASGVNETGSNIHDNDISQSLKDVPVDISQTENLIHVSAIINEKALSLTLSVRGRNEAGNMLYYNVTKNTEEFEALTAVYFDSFSDVVPIFKDEASHHSHMLRIYLKDNSRINDYYFIEIYDFELNMYDSIVSTVPVCESDYWYAKEFQPVDEFMTKGNTAQGNVPLNTIEEYEWTITQVYHDPSNLTYLESIVVYLSHDIVNIPRGGNAEWLHTIEVVDKDSICLEDSSFNSYGASCVDIRNPRLRAITPRNTAFFTTKTDGVVYRGPLIKASVDVSFALYALGIANISIGVGLEPGGRMDLDSTFRAYVNSNSRGYTRSVDITLGSGSLRSIGDYFQVLNSVRDYGGTTTSSDYLHASWHFDVYNWMSVDTTSYERTEHFSCRVY